MQRVWSASSLIGSNQGWINSLPHLSLSLSLALSLSIMQRGCYVLQNDPEDHEILGSVVNLCIACCILYTADAFHDTSHLVVSSSGCVGVEKGHLMKPSQ